MTLPLLLVSTLAAFAQAGPGVVALGTGTAIRLGLPPHPIHDLVCDDPSIVRARLGDTNRVVYIELEGMKPGATTCAVRYFEFPAQIFNVVVTASSPR